MVEGPGGARPWAARAQGARSRASALLAHGLVAEGAARLASSLFLGAAAGLGCLALCVRGASESDRPARSPQVLVLAGGLALAAAAATALGTRRERAEAARRVDRELGLGGLFEAAVEGARSPGPFQPLLEEAVARAVSPARVRRALELPWALSLGCAAVGLWAFLAAVSSAREVRRNADAPLRWQRAAAELSAAASAVPGDGRESSDPGPWREWSRRAQRGARDGQMGEREARELFADLQRAVRELSPSDPRYEALESARLALQPLAESAPLAPREGGAAPAPSERAAGQEATPGGARGAAPGAGGGTAGAPSAAGARESEPPRPSSGSDPDRASSAGSAAAASPLGSVPPPPQRPRGPAERRLVDAWLQGSGGR